MRALVLTEPWRAEVREIDKPQLNPGWALVRPRLVGICGSDLHAYTGSSPMVKYPVVPGHEFVGEVVEIEPPAGKAMWIAGRRPPERLAAGDRVVADPAVPCGQCRACRTGRYNVCITQKVIGVHLPGAMAELVAVRTDCLSLVPDHLSDEAAAMVEPMSIGMNACRRGKVKRGDWVVIIGGGMIGLAALMHARAREARVAVVEPVEVRRRLAQQVGADVVAAPDEVGSGIDGWGWDGLADVVIEASGTDAGLALGLRLAAPGGRVVVLGFWPQQIKLPATEITKKELDVVGSRLHGGTVAPTLAMMSAGLINPLALLGGVEPLERAPDLLRRLAAKEIEAVKMLVRVDN